MTILLCSNLFIVIVSHDSGFLNNTITDVLHLNRFKLRRYRGNLEAFVKAVPEAKSYYTLEAAEDYKFKLPDPPFLDGVKTKEKALLKMRKVGFQYPSQPVQQLYDISLQVSLSSRVAILGPNGSGKSTLVKLLTAEMEPNKGGEVWKHPNLVIGYVAQHAFHHIDQHLDKTPLEYMLWRYQTGEDLEEMMKANRQISEEEEKKMKEGGNVIVEGQKRVIDEIVGRKKLKQSYEYEITFKGMSTSENIWMPRDELIKRGFEKKVLEVDTREAQRLGLLRPLVRREIEKHMADFGLEPEFVSHNTMRGLSGGQKVKIVLGAATWRRPHIICLDEPTSTSSSILCYCSGNTDIFAQTTSTVSRSRHSSRRSRRSRAVSSSSRTTVTSPSPSALRSGPCATVASRLPATTGSRARAPARVSTRRPARRRTRTTRWATRSTRRRRRRS